jgi:DNA sulfur modification protein DndD
MFLRHLALRNYGVFRKADFELATTADRPLILITGNNGAGKTSLLEAIRLAFHGRRAFDTPLGEAEYLRLMESRFHSGDRGKPCSVALDFEYVDQYTTHRIAVERSWALRRQRIAEDLFVTLDGARLSTEDADDLLSSIVPPEIARYFFFDGERIQELADWELENESALFHAVADLLGLNVLDQLRSDVLRIAATGQKVGQGVRDLSQLLDDARCLSNATSTELRSAKVQLRKLRGSLDKARGAVRRIGVMHQSELAEAQASLAQLIAERRSLHEEAERAASDVLPLLCARTLRERFGKEIDARRRLEEREIVSTFIEEHAEDIRSELVSDRFKLAEARRILDTLGRVSRGKPLPVSATLPSLSRTESSWMQRVIERELPELAGRMRSILARMRAIDDEINRIQERTSKAPVEDSAGEAALAEFEKQQREFLEQEACVSSIEQKAVAAAASLEATEQLAKVQRMTSFRTGRLRLREELIRKVLEALPVLAERLHASKEQQFGRLLGDALRELWHKTDRLVAVEVSFSQRRIALMDSYGELRKRDLSAAEKQLFAVAFIYALAKLSGRQMPFVIDTPLGRLDREHRHRFVAGFLPSASHQVVLLSTDTEIVGSLFDDVRPLIAHHHELADQNDGATSPVQLALA